MVLAPLGEPVVSVNFNDILVAADTERIMGWIRSGRKSGKDAYAKFAFLQEIFISKQDAKTFTGIIQQPFPILLCTTPALPFQTNNEMSYCHFNVILDILFNSQNFTVKI